jgi:hypothetical protein
MTNDLVKQAREALNGVYKEPWEIEWYICRADERDVQHAKTRKLKRGEARKDVQVGDELWRVPKSIGPIFPDHDHWSGSSLTCDVADAMFVITARSLLPLMADRIEELELEVETWKSRAIHQNEVAGRLEAKLSESEALLAKAMEALEKVQAFVRELEPYAAQGTTLVPALREACETFIELKGKTNE